MNLAAVYSLAVFQALHVILRIVIPRIRLKVKPSKALDKIPALELWGITCHMGSHTCHPTQVNVPYPNPSQ